MRGKKIHISLKSFQPVIKNKHYNNLAQKSTRRPNTHLKNFFGGCDTGDGVLINYTSEPKKTTKKKKDSHDPLILSF